MHFNGKKKLHDILLSSNVQLIELIFASYIPPLKKLSHLENVLAVSKQITDITQNNFCLTTTEHPEFMKYT